MDVREKLVELLGANTCKCDYCEDCEYCEDEDACIAYLKNSMADYLIAHGVTVQEWISVKDRLPEEPLQTVIVTNGKETCVGVYSGVCDEFGVMCGTDKRFGVTHWMPLPQPPKGE